MNRLVVSLLFAAVAAFSQGNTGTITGAVTDPTGAAVPGADVTATNMDTGAPAKTVTNERGEYTLPSLLAARYSVSVSKTGFKAQTTTGIEVNAGITSTANIKLEIGQATETVEVAAGAEMVQAANAELSSTITTRQ